MEANAGEAVHHGPHILATKGDIIEGMSFFGLPVTTTTFSTWLFMGVLILVVALFFVAIKTDRLPRVRTLGLDLISRLDGFITDTIGSKKNGRFFFPLVGGFFVFILLGNIFGLILDWITLVVPSLHAYLRPFNSDINTTVVMGATIILVAQVTSMVNKGFFTHWRHYFFNFSGHNIIERIINVPVGWIHLFSEFSRVVSLSVRLFANIFAGAVLIAVMAYIGTMIPYMGGLVVLPFWFYELLVAFLQAFIFSILSLVYFQEASEHASH